MCPAPDDPALAGPAPPLPVDAPPNDRTPRPVDSLVPLVYDELRRMARRHLRGERRGHTLRTTALVHEAYLRLVQQHGLSGEKRTRFFAAASNTMRRVLVDHARRRCRLKRGGGMEPLALGDIGHVGDVAVGDVGDARGVRVGDIRDAGDLGALLSEEDCRELVALDEALDRLADVKPRAATVVQHRFFGGLNLEETADVLGVSSKTVQRDWIVARAWLRKEVAHGLGAW